jgi:hypothetical protein
MRHRKNSGFWQQVRMWIPAVASLLTVIVNWVKK